MGNRIHKMYCDQCHTITRQQVERDHRSATHVCYGDESFITKNPMHTNRMPLHYEIYSRHWCKRCCRKTEWYADYISTSEDCWHVDQRCRKCNNTDTL